MVNSEMDESKQYHSISLFDRFGVPIHYSPFAIRLLSRPQINTAAWDACVSASKQSIVYAYSWYLDAVLPEPDWQWVGLVLPDEAGGYRAVMPVPLRRKYVAGAAYGWVVHQPLFCQFLGVFSRDAQLDPTPFLRAVCQRFRYGSTFSFHQQPPDSVGFDLVRPLATHVLNLAVGYKTIYQNYTHDRRLNLRRAVAANWTITDSTDPEPLLTLFRDNHAGGIQGGVAEEAYVIFRRVYAALHERGLATLRYALRDGRPEAGALFVEHGNRIIYLFNAASEAGRRGNARTLLIDRMIQENAPRGCAGRRPLLVDFESPEKPSIASFYRSFGAVDEPFWTVRWNRLNRVERTLLAVRQALKKASARD